MALTEKAIRDAKPGPKTRIEWDRDIKGFGLRVTAKGVRAFILNYRVNGRERRATIGRPGEMSLKEARRRAGELLAGVRDGADPLREREEARAEPTVADGLDRFFDEFVPRRMADGRLAPRTVKDYRAQANRTVRPALGKQRIGDVTRADIERAIAPRAPVQRNRTVAFIARLFAVFEEWAWREPNSNPARRIEKTREEPRDRVLAPSEIEALGAALADIENPFVAGALRFLLMTGWRTGEALALRWSDLNFETGAVVLPTSKTGRETRTLGAMARQVIIDIPRLAHNPFVFAGQDDGALTYATLRRRFRLACRAAGIENARLHDIRRSVATSAAAHGVSVFMLRDLLGHKTVAMANRYARQSGSALQQTQDAHGERMAAMLSGKGGEIVPLRKRDAG